MMHGKGDIYHIVDSVRSLYKFITTTGFMQLISSTLGFLNGKHFI